MNNKKNKTKPARKIPEVFLEDEEDDISLDVQSLVHPTGCTPVVFYDRDEEIQEIRLFSD